MKVIFEKWFGEDKCKMVSLVNYKDDWAKPTFYIRDNGGRRKYGDLCYDLHIILGYLSFEYTNFGLQKGKRSNILKLFKKRS